LVTNHIVTPASRGDSSELTIMRSTVFMSNAILCFGLAAASAGAQTIKIGAPTVLTGGFADEGNELHWRPPRVRY